jgi:hypothetical protein
MTVGTCMETVVEQWFPGAPVSDPATRVGSGSGRVGHEWWAGVHPVTAATATTRRALDELTDAALHGLVPEFVKEAAHLRGGPGGPAGRAAYAAHQRGETAVTAAGPGRPGLPRGCTGPPMRWVPGWVDRVVRALPRSGRSGRLMSGYPFSGYDQRAGAAADREGTRRLMNISERQRLERSVGGEAWETRTRE